MPSGNKYNLHQLFLAREGSFQDSLVHAYMFSVTDGTAHALSLSKFCYGLNAWAMAMGHVHTSGHCNVIECIRFAIASITAKFSSSYSQQF